MDEGAPWEFLPWQFLELSPPLPCYWSLQWKKKSCKSPWLYILLESGHLNVNTFSQLYISYITFKMCIFLLLSTFIVH